MLRKYRVRDYDFKLIILVVAITTIGVLAIGSARESLQSRQITGAVLGFFLMLVISLFDYSVILRFYWIMLRLTLFFCGWCVLWALRRAAHSGG